MQIFVQLLIYSQKHTCFHCWGIYTAPQSLVNSISIEEDCIPTSFPSFILDESADILTIHSINSLVVTVQTFFQIQIPKPTYCNVSIFNSYYPKARFLYLIRRTKRVQLQYLSYSKSTADFVYNIMTYVTLSNAIICNSVTEWIFTRTFN